MIEKVYVNGKCYRKKTHREVKPLFNKVSPLSVLVYNALSMFDDDKIRYEDKRYCGDLVKEYELIELKKSKLSKADRDSIEYRFNNEYELYEEKIEPLLIGDSSDMILEAKMINDCLNMPQLPIIYLDYIDLLKNE